MPTALIAIDQGTTSTRAIAFDAALKPLASAQQELRQIYPAPGWVEHDPEEIWAATVATVRSAMAKAGLAAKDIAGIGITNQRETTVDLGPRHRPSRSTRPSSGRTGARPIFAMRCAAPAMSRRSPPRPGCCSILIFPPARSPGCSNTWRARAPWREAGRLAFGTIDCFLLWRLTGGKVHATDASNAARTLLFDIGTRGMGRRPVPDVRRAAIAVAAGSATARASSAPPRPNCSARPFAFSAWPATSRRRRSGRAASSPA